jgi:hypothetical protein
MRMTTKPTSHSVSIFLAALLIGTLGCGTADEDDDDSGVDPGKLEAQSGDPEVPGMANRADVVASGARAATATADASLNSGGSIRVLDLVHDNPAATDSQVQTVRISIGWRGAEPLAPGTYDVLPARPEDSTPYTEVPFKITQGDGAMWRTDTSAGRLVVTESTATSIQGTLVVAGTWLEDKGDYRAAWAFNAEAQ